MDYHAAAEAQSRSDVTTQPTKFVTDNRLRNTVLRGTPQLIGALRGAGNLAKAVAAVFLMCPNVLSK